MSAPKHTAGPWERLQGFAEKGHPSYAEGQYVIRIVQKREPGQTEFVKVALVDAGPVDSNARLIAAAPDLLEAGNLAKSAIRHDVDCIWLLNHTDYSPRPESNCDCGAYEAGVALSAAIAKATGQ